jgi:NADH:ubiquinone oxidoreductase subunit F (NADH-binding)
VPHLVLDGAVAVAAAVGAREVVVALEETSQAEAAAVATAIRERDARLEATVALLPRGFVSGEETAIVSFLNGGAARPTFKPPLPAQRGVRGRPTLVQNAETLAHVALIARHGPAWFRTAGTRLVTVSGAVARPGVVELPAAATVRDAVAAAGGASGRPRAILVGGYFGRWLAADEAARLRPPGAGAVVVLPQDACGLYETARVARYLAAESAGQCGPCVNGLTAIAHDLTELLRGHDVPRLARRLDVIAGRGACRHPDGAVELVRSGLRLFGCDHRGCDRRHLGVLPTPGMHAR